MESFMRLLYREVLSRPTTGFDEAAPATTEAQTKLVRTCGYSTPREAVELLVYRRVDIDRVGPASLA